LRQAHGLSQSDFGKVLGVSFQQIQKFENGLNRMSVSQLSAAAEHFGVDLAYFIPRPGAAGPSPTSNVDRDDTQAFVRSRRGRQLIEAFLAIRNESTREAMLRLLRTMADAE
jgi:transcriptional regulator with XRE-family HTH domain